MVGANGTPLVKRVISLGVATLAPGSNEGPELIRAADERLYEAKSNGRNRVCA